jgi:F-type H+-transporting ATPase subunit epsilon
VRTFVVEIASPRRVERIEDAVAFGGRDASGAFSLLAGHARFVTALVRGIARIRVRDGAPRWLAFDGGALRFAGNRLSIGTPRWFDGSDHRALREAFDAELARADHSERRMREHVAHLEEALNRRLWRAVREGRLA